MNLWNALVQTPFLGEYFTVYDFQYMFKMPSKKKLFIALSEKCSTGGAIHKCILVGLV